ncbi:MAG: ArsB/NhaD family transporter [Candidatus Altiarchaeota archaeon]|nr:ArsB/NhaD family transporter [Candidatus Altiarchaeota archaeon]
MKTKKESMVPLILLFILLSSHAATADDSGTHEAIVTGQIKDLKNQPVGEAEIRVYINGQAHETEETIRSAQDVGVYSIKIEKVTGDAEITIKVSKPSYKTEEIKVGAFVFKEDTYYAFKDVILTRKTGMAFYISALILIIIYILISFEIIHRTNASLLGAASLLFITYTIGTFDRDYFIISFEGAIKAIDFNVIFLLMGMMIIVAIMKRTGVFQWMAYKAYQFAKGNVWHLCVILMIITAITSALLDNVTTMILLTPVVVEIALILGMSPLPLLVPLVLASNIGGTATLIGDPPNIMIGSYAHLTFNEFIINLTPVVVVSMAVLIIMMRFQYKKEYMKVGIDDIDGLLKRLREEYRITDKTLLGYSLAVLGFVTLLFAVHGILHMEPSIAALTGASVLLLLSRADIVDMLEEVEWPTLIFFMMLFIIVGATVETGLIGMLADLVSDLSGGSLVFAIILVLWVSAIASAIVDNIPFTATMLPIVAYLTQTLPGAESMVLWWALALGACFGGNGTLIGASANLVTAGISERAGHPIRFIDFLKVGAPVMFVSVFIATIYLLLIYT